MVEEDVFSGGVGERDESFVVRISCGSDAGSQTAEKRLLTTGTFFKWRNCFILENMNNELISYSQSC